jgi:hypothetical protein
LVKADIGKRKGARRADTRRQIDDALELRGNHRLSDLDSSKVNATAPPMVGRSPASRSNARRRRAHMQAQIAKAKAMLVNVNCAAQSQFHSLR